MITNTTIMAALKQGTAQHRFRIELRYRATPAQGIPGARFLVVNSLPIIGGGTLSIDGKANIWRTLDFTTHRSAIPGDIVDVEELLLTRGEIRVYFSTTVPAGVDGRAAASTSEQLIAVLMITGVHADAATDQVDISCQDYGVVLDEYPFVTTYTPINPSLSANTNPLSYFLALRDIVEGPYAETGFFGYPSFAIDSTLYSAGAYSNLYTATKKGLAFSGSRWDAINTLLKSCGMRIQPIEPSSQYKIWPATYNPDSGWTIDTGTGGALVSAGIGTSRSDTYNAVQMSWASADGQTSGVVFQVDNDSTSPTYWSGPFGRRVRVEDAVDTIETQALAIDAATALLNEYKGFRRTIDLKASINPLLEPNDSVNVVYDDTTGRRTEVHLIDSMSIDLQSATMSMTTRVISVSVTAPFGAGTYGSGPYGG